jgi:hypothetical protein
VLRLVTLGPPAAPRPGVIARRRGDQFHGAYALGGSLATLDPVAAPLGARGDLLDHDGAAARWGFHSCYRSSLAPDFDGVVYALRRIGGEYFAIVASQRAARTLARARGGTWELLRHPLSAVPSPGEPGREMWLRGASGELYQAFYFGPPAPEKVVVWWHGGPRENVSPRFNPYFARLQGLGFGVLAVNYPGSTGRGAEYERRFEPSALADCVAAVWAYLAENDVRHVVSWSVSTGNALQVVLLAQGLPVSAVVDQSGWGRSPLLERTAARGIPFYAIRGRHDPYAPIARVAYWYPGGHDITAAEDFLGLFDDLPRFLGAITPVRYDDAAPADARILIDPGGEDGGLEAELTFELATHVLRTCFPGGGAAVTRTGHPALRPAAGGAARVARWTRGRERVSVVRLRLRPDGARRGELDAPGPGEPAARATPERGGRAAARSPSTSPTLRHGGGAAPERGGPAGVVAEGAGVPGARTIVLQPFDHRDEDEAPRLRAREIAADGTLVRPRLREAAEALCPALAALAAAP